THSLIPAQARWLSGYFAGLEAGMGTGVAVEPAALAAPSARKLTILYGTETGNAAELARGLEAKLKERGLACTLSDMADYKQRQLAQEQDVLIIVSTYGEGDPPQPATGFFEFVEGRKAPKLPDARFAVLALGDSTYEFYCQAGKRLDARFEELGAKRLATRVDCDVDYDDAAAAWTESIVAQLAADETAAASVVSVQAATGAATASAYDKRNP